MRQTNYACISNTSRSSGGNSEYITLSSASQFYNPRVNQNDTVGHVFLGIKFNPYLRINLKEFKHTPGNINRPKTTLSFQSDPFSDPMISDSTLFLGADKGVFINYSYSQRTVSSVGVFFGVAVKNARGVVALGIDPSDPWRRFEAAVSVSKFFDVGVAIDMTGFYDLSDRKLNEIERTLLLEYSSATRYLGGYP